MCSPRPREYVYHILNRVVFGVSLGHARTRRDETQRCDVMMRARNGRGPTLRRVNKWAEPGYAPSNRTNSFPLRKLFNNIFTLMFFAHICSVPLARCMVAGDRGYGVVCIVVDGPSNNNKNSNWWRKFFVRFYRFSCRRRHRHRVHSVFILATCWTKLFLDENSAHKIQICNL